jgi:hypothetical protein
MRVIQELYIPSTVGLVAANGYVLWLGSGPAIYLEVATGCLVLYNPSYGTIHPRLGEGSTERQLQDFLKLLDLLNQFLGSDICLARNKLRDLAGSHSDRRPDRLTLPSPISQV